MTLQLTQGERRHLRKRFFLERTRFIVLKRAILHLYQTGVIEHLDMCIEMNELEVAYRAVVSRVDASKVTPSVTFAVGDSVAGDHHVGRVHSIEPGWITVRFPASGFPPPKVQKGHGSLHGTIKTMRFKLCSDGTYRNGRFRDPLQRV